MKARSRDPENFRVYLHDLGREIRDLAQAEERRRSVVGNAGFEKSTAVLHEDGRPHLKTLSFSGYEENPFYYNLGGGKFAEIGGALGVTRVEDGRGLASADLDGDGDLDLVLRNVFEPTLLYLRNHLGTERPAIEVRLRGMKSNRFGIGTRVTVDGRMQELVCGEGYLSCGPPSLHFGLGAESKAKRIKIRWPSGARQEILDVEPCILTVTEGGSFEKKPFREASRPTGTPRPRPAHVGESLEIALRSTDGRTANLEGKWSVLCLWSVTCKSCFEESRRFGEFSETMERRGAAYYAVNIDDDLEQLDAFVKEQKFAVPIWIGGEFRDRLLNPGEPLVPTTIVLDPAGRVRRRHVGTTTVEDLERLLR